MRLKSLEIKGFKSFANPTILYFDENVTGVVGPNGSGKSNVVDAFRWVLGEQKSKELRLEQMGDVLFNGSSGKKQANMAEVSITFDNTKNILPTEYQTVKITRSLYRSGDSEYRINDVNCRLKDIHALLMDTGIGSNSYSIIELGMVDDILHDKENARRRMFEQAAGISKFKKRKKETISKLKLTNADLERVEDLLFEIESNLKELEKQARRTKRYYELKDKYKANSVMLYKMRWDENISASKTVESQINDAKVEYNELSVSLSKQEATLEEEKRKNLVEEKNLTEYQKKLNDLIDRVRRLENDKNLTQQKIQFSKNNIQKASEEIQRNKPLIKEYKEKEERVESQILEKEKETKKLQESLAQAQEQLDQINDQFNKHRDSKQAKAAQLQSTQGQIFEIEKSIAISENKKHSLDSNISSYQNQINNLRNGVSEKKVDLEKYNEQITLLKKELESLENKEQSKVEQQQKLEQKIGERKDELSKVNRKLDALMNEHALLVSMVENMEGFPESVKFLHNQWSQNHVILSDVINCEEKYRAAVEQYLQPYLNYFIVENIEEAKSAIQLLQKSQKGKAHFFLLDQITSSNQDNKTKLKRLSDIIEVDNKYRNLIELICADVYLIDENKVYEEALFSDYPAISILDKNGAFLRTKHQISGGSVGLFEGKKIGRKKRIEQLEDEIKKEQSKKEKLQSNLENELQILKDLRKKDFKNEIKQKTLHLDKVEKKMLVLQSQLSNVDEQISSLEQRIETSKQELVLLKDELTDKTKSKNDLIKSLQASKDEVSAQGEELHLLSNKLSEARDTYNRSNIAMIQSENFTLTLKKELEHQVQRIKDVHQTLYDSERTLELQEKETLQSQELLEKLNAELSGLYASRDKEKEKLSTAEQDYFKARGALTELEDQIRVESKKAQEKQYLINQLKDKANDYKFKGNSIKERLNIEFQLNIADLLKVEIAEGVTYEKLDLEVEKYKRRLENYGEINPMALEAYDEMEKRHAHIVEQRDDIEEAKVSLMNTISEIEQTATQLFLDSFEEVRKHFVVVFRSLFTQDDDCDLVLLEPEDPLNSKIEIIAKPKGKRPKSLSQLSGGEKTLTATALLFSLYLLKPAPFCIFDEVDAPLDDTNIQKFANIIRAFADRSQFIIVTHNKATMAEVDVLYGVYMQKKGISSVSSVDFRSYEEKGTVQNTQLSTV